MLIARFDAQCGDCNGDIIEGVSTVVYDSGKGWMHADPEDCTDGWESFSWDVEEDEDDD